MFSIFAALIHLGLLELDYLFGLLQQLDVGFQLTFGQSQSAECELSISIFKHTFDFLMVKNMNF